MPQNDRTEWAVITGASSGFGAIFAEQLAGRGMSLILAGRDQARLAAVHQRVRAIAPDVEVQSVVGQDYPARLFGSVLAQVLGGPIGLVSGTLTVTPTAGGQAVVIAGGTSAAG